MTRYADPTRCLDCRTPLTSFPPNCPACGMPLDDPVTHELFRTLQYADALVVRLRSARVTTPAGAPASPDPTPAGPASPRPVPAPRRTGLRLASVPSVLLALGALCLLVAAVTFLAVAWAWMGIGGRTAVLLALTVAAAGSGLWLARRGLRVAAESLTTVSLGLVVLDALGGVSAGWFGDPGPAATTTLVGLSLAATAAALVWTSVRLAVPQLAVALGLVVALAGIDGTTSHDRALAVSAVLLLVAVSRLGRAYGASVLAASAALGAAAWWAWLAGPSLADAVAAPTVESLWLNGNGLGLVAAALILLLPAALVRHRHEIAAGSVASATTLVTFTAALPALDEGSTAVAGSALAALVAWTAVAAAIPTRWLLVAAAPLLLAAVPAVTLLAGLGAEALARVAGTGDPFTRAADVRLAVEHPVFSPVLLLPLTAAVLLSGRVVLDREGRAPWPWIATASLALAGLATLASYAVPLGAVTGVLAGGALGLTLLAVRRTQDQLPIALAAAVVAAASVCFSLPSTWLTTGCSSAATVVGAALLSARSARPRRVGEVLLPAVLGVLVWCVGDLGGVELGWQALAVLAVLGAVAVARPRVRLEASAATTGLVAAAVSVSQAPDQLTALAVHLTVAGTMVTLSSLVHAARRVLGWLGGLLLAAATWTRLFDLGVDEPEAYTLPSAIALLLVGLQRLLRDPGASSAALLPGLALGTVPSLLWVVVVEPVSPRAVMLGAACLALVLAGTRLGWSSPLVVGAVAGGLLVLREVAPYAGGTPRWLLIGVAGALLTVVGVTWERRVLELRQATTYLDRLR